jgi:hypothetical protein
MLEMERKHLLKGRAAQPHHYDFQRLFNQHERIITSWERNTTISHEVVYKGMQRLQCPVMRDGGQIRRRAHTSLQQKHDSALNLVVLVFLLFIGVSLP